MFTISHDSTKPFSYISGSFYAGYLILYVTFKDYTLSQQRTNNDLRQSGVVKFYSWCLVFKKNWYESTFEQCCKADDITFPHVLVFCKSEYFIQYSNCSFTLSHGYILLRWKYLSACLCSTDNLNISFVNEAESCLRKC